MVVDASIAIAWLHPLQRTSLSDAALKAIIQGAPAHAPSFWTLEVANVLLALKRRKKLQPEEMSEALMRVRKFNFRFDNDWISNAFTDISEIAATYGLSVYDATYLELAMRKNLPLSCKDGPLQTAATKAGVKLWSP